MATLERRSATAPGLGLALGQGLAAAASDYDYALLDCPPTLGLLMVNALAAADQLVVPTQTEPLGVHGMEGMLKTAAMIERSRRKPLPARILPTLFDRRTRACTETLERLRERHPERTWVQAVPLDTRLRDAAELTHAELSGEVLQSRGFDAYQRALAWFAEQNSIRNSLTRELNHRVKNTLANVLSMTRYHGAVAACGLAGGMDLPTSVAPFILRGVSLLGVDSVMCPQHLRREAWRRLDSDLDRRKLAQMTEEIGLDGVLDAGQRIVEGRVRGRIVVKIG